MHFCVHVFINVHGGGAEPFRETCDTSRLSYNWYSHSWLCRRRLEKFQCLKNLSANFDAFHETCGTSRWSYYHSSCSYLHGGGADPFHETCDTSRLSYNQSWVFPEKAWKVPMPSTCKHMQTTLALPLPKSLSKLRCLPWNMCYVQIVV